MAEMMVPLTQPIKSASVLNTQDSWERSGREMEMEGENLQHAKREHSRHTNLLLQAHVKGRNYRDMKRYNDDILQHAHAAIYIRQFINIYTTPFYITIPKIGDWFTLEDREDAGYLFTSALSRKDGVGRRTAHGERGACWAWTASA